MKISAKLGLLPVGPKPGGGVCARPQCNYWPHNVRPDEYYLGAVRVLRQEDGGGNETSDLSDTPPRGKEVEVIS